jgi:reverse gyrase
MDKDIYKNMSEEELRSEIAKILGFPPRGGQFDAIRKLVADQEDLILIAPTGWGKSAVFQAVPSLVKGICLMIMPLTLLEEDQVSALFSTVRVMIHLIRVMKARIIERIPDAKPCILNASTKSKSLLAAIRRGDYTHSK